MCCIDRLKLQSIADIEVTYYQEGQRDLAAQKTPMLLINSRN